MKRVLSLLLVVCMCSVTLMGCTEKSEKTNVLSFTNVDVGDSEEDVIDKEGDNYEYKDEATIIYDVTEKELFGFTAICKLLIGFNSNGIVSNKTITYSTDSREETEKIFEKIKSDIEKQYETEFKELDNSSYIKYYRWSIDSDKEITLAYQDNALTFNYVDLKAAEN